MFLIVGGDSEIGSATAAHLRERRGVITTTRRADNPGDGRVALDMTEDLSRWEPPAGVTAACICAAVARLADCAADPAGSARVNVTGTVALAERLFARGIYVLFLSTNQVFDGRTAHTPADAPTAPMTEYGRQKACAEAALLARMREGAPVAILRLAKVVSPKTALLRDWRVALGAGESIRAFHDMTMAPAPVDAVVRAIAALMGDRAAGVFQLTGPRDVAYAEVGNYLAERLSADPALVVRTSVRDSGLSTGAAPAHTTLDSRALGERYRIFVPDPWKVLDGILVDME